MSINPLPTPQICFPGGNYLHFDVTTKHFNLSAQQQLKRIEIKVSKKFQGIEDIRLGLNVMTIHYNPQVTSPITLAKYLRKTWPAS
ncbi:MAG TPA: carboxyltransferase domain-containing protein [Pseudomonas sp.]|nr:carboxyltransferase domain-containing protein [Pseudomonas sp.]